MSNLVVKEKNTTPHICPTLSKMEAEIVEKSNSLRISESEDNTIANELLCAIGQAVLTIGSKNINETDIEIMVAQLTEYLNIKHQNARIGEIVNAIKLGSFGEYKKEGEILYLTAANIIQWFKRYEEEKREILSKQSKFEQEILNDEIEKQKFMEAKEKYWKELPRKIAECSEVGGERSKMSSIYFENLWKFGILKLDSEEIKVLKSKAKEEAIQRLREQRKNIIRIGEENVQNMANKIAKEKAFYLWIEENRHNNIEDIVKKAINNGK